MIYYPHLSFLSFEQNEMVDVDLYALSELLLKINNGLSEIIDAFLGDIHEQRSTLKIPCHHVLVALRRIHWLKPILQHKAEALERKWDNDTHLLKVLNHCAENIKLFGRKDWPEMFDLFDVLSTGDDNVKQLRDALRREATEEICYKIHPFLTLPCDEDAYCGVAVDLISDLALAAAKYEWSWGGPKPIDSLFETFMNIASKASIEVREPSDMSKLTFPRTCFKRYQLENRAVLMDQPDGTRCILTYYGGKGSDVEDPEPVVVDDATFWDPKIKDILHSDFYLSRQVIFGKLKHRIPRKTLLTASSRLLYPTCQLWTLLPNGIWEICHLTLWKCFASTVEFVSKKRGDICRTRSMLKRVTSTHFSAERNISNI
jgi:hypothetical protein